jgi:hypothetical protein
MPVERQCAINIGGFRHGEPRDKAVSGPGEAVIAPHPWLSALKKVDGIEIAGVEQRDELTADRAHIIDGDDETARSEVPHTHPVDDVAPARFSA